MLTTLLTFKSMFLGPVQWRRGEKSWGLREVLTWLAESSSWLWLLKAAFASSSLKNFSMKWGMHDPWLATLCLSPWVSGGSSPGKGTCTLQVGILHAWPTGRYSCQLWGAGFFQLCPSQLTLISVLWVSQVEADIHVQTVGHTLGSPGDPTEGFLSCLQVRLGERYCRHHQSFLKKSTNRSHLISSP